MTGTSIKKQSTAAPRSPPCVPFSSMSPYLTPWFRFAWFFSFFPLFKETLLIVVKGTRQKPYHLHHVYVSRSGAFCTFTWPRHHHRRPSPELSSSCKTETLPHPLFPAPHPPAPSPWQPPFDSLLYILATLGPSYEWNRTVFTLLTGLGHSA